MDFVMDALATGRRIKCLTCVDDFTDPDPKSCAIQKQNSGMIYTP